MAKKFEELTKTTPPRPKRYSDITEESVLFKINHLLAKRYGDASETPPPREEPSPLPLVPLPLKPMAMPTPTADFIPPTPVQNPPLQSLPETPLTPMVVPPAMPQPETPTKTFPPRMPLPHMPLPFGSGATGKEKSVRFELLKIFLVWPPFSPVPPFAGFPPSANFPYPLPPMPPQPPPPPQTPAMDILPDPIPADPVVPVSSSIHKDFYSNILGKPSKTFNLEEKASLS